MAQQVVIAGAMFNDVPSISVPDSNNVYHPFLDTTIATNAAAASDIAQGKLAYVNGSLVTGTNQGGGGGGSLAWGTIRDDATLVKSWTYDKLIYADEGITIPAYTTSSTTLKNGAALETASLNFSDYSYILLYRFLVSPVYSDSTISSARQIYFATSGMYCPVFIPISAFSYGGTSATSTSATSMFTALNPPAFSRIVYYGSDSLVRAVSTTAYGAYCSMLTVPSITMATSSPYSTGTLTVTSPTFNIRGSSNYLNSTNWGKLTDIRYQYIYELYSVPQSSTVHGWEMESQFRHILDCANGTGTLT